MEIASLRKAGYTNRNKIFGGKGGPLLTVLYVLTALTAVLLAAGLGAALAAMHRGRDFDPRDEKSIAKSCWAKYQDQVLSGAAWILSQPTEEMAVESHDGLRLSGRLLEADRPRGTILLFHGYRSMACIDFSCAARYYHDLGYNLLLIDQRAHGHSQGTYITYGVLERQDCRAWCEAAYRRFGSEMPLYLSGVSMGAATVLMAADLPLPPTVRGIIADCGFTSPRDIMVHVMKTRLHLPEYPLIWSVEFWARILAHIRLDQCSTVETLAHSRLPVLMIHGTADRFVPCDMSRRGYAACTSEKHLLEVEGAGHGASFLVDKPAYTRAVEDFLSAHPL